MRQGKLVRSQVTTKSDNTLVAWSRKFSYILLLKSHELSTDSSHQWCTINRNPISLRCRNFSNKVHENVPFQRFQKLFWNFTSNKGLLCAGLLWLEASHNEIKQKIRTQTSNHEWWSRKSCWNVLLKTNEQSGEWILKHKSLSSLFMYSAPWISKSTAYPGSRRVFS